MSVIASSTLPKISVAMPVYNRADWIARTLDCIFAQSLQPFEVVLCDDGSTDQLMMALEPYKEKITLLEIANSGPGNARKTAIEACQGDWIALCDSDDFWQPDHLLKFSQALALMPDLQWYFANFKQTETGFIDKFFHAPAGWLEQISEPISLDSTNAFRRIKPTEVFTSLVQYQACFQTAMIFARHFYEQVGGIDPAYSRMRSEDAHLTWRMALHKAPGIICTLPTVLINKHDNNFSASYRQNLLGEIYILQQLMPLVNDSQYSSFVNDICDKKWLEIFRFAYWERDRLFIRQHIKNFPFKLFKFKDWLRLLSSFGPAAKK